MARICIALVSHVLNPPVRAVFDRLARELPADHELRMILSTDDPRAGLAGLSEKQVDRISTTEIFRQPYPAKCVREGWDMAGNLDLVFLEFRHRHPQYDHYWFMEYDVFWQGHWSVFFEHFRPSTADLLAATIVLGDDVPLRSNFDYPSLKVPDGMRWERDKFLKAFLPLCRLSAAAMDALDEAYRFGLGGHYEVTISSVAAHACLLLEDYGGNGRFVKPGNVNRFYFATAGTYTHSPGNFVFRPAQTALPRLHTLWHPVKPEGVPAWHPLQYRGNFWKTNRERLKLYIFQAVIRFWFATRWRPLPAPEPTKNDGACLLSPASKRV